MSVLIKGMEMPKNCAKCFVGFCKQIGCEHYIGFDDHDRARHPDCPLIEVPEPHGRLIDANAVTLECGPYEYDDWCKWALEQYLDAPTVIPATEEEKHEKGFSALREL